VAECVFLIFYTTQADESEAAELIRTIKSLAAHSLVPRAQSEAYNPHAHVPSRQHEAAMSCCSVLLAACAKSLQQTRPSFDRYSPPNSLAQEAGNALGKQASFIKLQYEFIMKNTWSA
jgi:hypothetical protein